MHVLVFVFLNISVSVNISVSLYIELFLWSLQNQSTFPQNMVCSMPTMQFLLGPIVPHL